MVCWSASRFLASGWMVGIMALQTHHISYTPEWTVELNGDMHRVVTTVKRMRATPENYVVVTNLVHSLVAEWNRIRKALDTRGVEKSIK